MASLYSLPTIARGRAVHTIAVGLLALCAVASEVPTARADCVVAESDQGARAVTSVESLACDEQLAAAFDVVSPEGDPMFVPGNGVATSLALDVHRTGSASVRLHPEGRSAWAGWKLAAVAGEPLRLSIAIRLSEPPVTETELVGLWDSPARERIAYVAVAADGGLSIHDAFGQNIATSTPLPVGGWATLALSVTPGDPDGRLRMDIDGLQAGELKGTVAPSFDALYLGTPAGPGSYDVYFDSLTVDPLPEQPRPDAPVQTVVSLPQTTPDEPRPDEPPVTPVPASLPAADVVADTEAARDVPGVGPAEVVTRTVLREAAADESALVGTLQPGSVVDVLDSPWNGFLLVRAGDDTGWVPADFLAAPGTVENAPIAPGAGFIVERGAAVLESPEAGAATVAHPALGERIEIMGKPNGGFYPISTGAVTGWVAEESLAGGLPIVEARQFSAGSAYTADSVNLRKGPGLLYAPATTLEAGVTVQLTGRVENGFAEVQHAGGTGWAYSDYLVPIQSGLSQNAPRAGRTTDRLRLRAGPGIEYETITVMPAGTTVSIPADARSGFYPVVYGGVSGWASADYLAVAALPGSNTADGFGWPLVGPITSYFGPAHPLGIDIGTNHVTGLPVVASAAGTVGFVGGDACCSYGLYVRIDHGNGMTTLYGHLSGFRVAAGQQVAAGEVIGLSGNTGRSTGPHLHFEIRRNGVPLDPLSLLP